jgi:hypothetical protein
LADADADAEAATKNPSAPENTFNPATHTRFARRRRLIREREARHGHDLDALVPILASASAPLRASAEEGLQALRAWFAGCNEGRWTGFVHKASTAELQERQAGLVRAKDAVWAALEEFRSAERVRLIKPFERFFDGETGRLVVGVDGKGDETEMFAVRYVSFLFFSFLFRFFFLFGKEQVDDERITDHSSSASSSATPSTPSPRDCTAFCRSSRTSTRAAPPRACGSPRASGSWGVSSRAARL